MPELDSGGDATGTSLFAGLLHRIPGTNMIVFSIQAGIMIGGVGIRGDLVGNQSFPEFLGESG